MWEVTVHKYKHSQQNRRNMLRRLSKAKIITFLGQRHDSLVYLIPNHQAMEEYKKRKSK